MRQMLVIFVDADHKADVEQILDEYEPLGYSMIPEVLGKGVTGRKFGSRAFPGSSACYVAAVTDECEQKVVSRLQTLAAEKGTAEGLKVYSLAAQEKV